jgi:hypothetical protein
MRPTRNTPKLSALFELYERPLLAKFYEAQHRNLQIRQLKRKAAKLSEDLPPQDVTQQVCPREWGPRCGISILRAPNWLLTKWYKAPGESGRSGASKVRKIPRRRQRARTWWSHRSIASLTLCTSGYSCARSWLRRSTIVECFSSWTAARGMA